MASSTLVPNMMAGNNGMVDLSLQNKGIKPVGNGTGSNMPNPTSTLATAPNGAIPISMNPAANQPVLPPGTTGSMSTTPLLPTNGVASVSSAASTVPSASGTPSLVPTSNDANLNKQLTDEYGKGVGGTLASEIENLGSADSSYMKAYENAMAMPNSEQLTTLQTQLGNEGISGNSSTAALASADLLSQETSQEGLQEQQLLQSNVAESVGLTESLEGTANKAQQDTGWSIFGSVIGDIGGAVAGTLIDGV